ncbi:MAG: dehydrogenase [Abditibacteriota bacterium]|nr:dehydrogenase [Abditibacteriota bacterium]
MPKSQFVDPDFIRKPGFIEFDQIPVNQYNKTIRDEKKNFSKADFLRIYRDMRFIREFESMLYLIKTQSEYNGVQYSNPGPAHLSTGQEAAAVGQAYILNINDYSFGSHRSHGEILAKGLSAIEKLSDKELTDVMEGFFDGKVLKALEKGIGDETLTVKEKAVKFLIYGALSEIFARETGFHRGLGGSMHAFFTPFGIYPNNAIVGGSATVALGAALYKRCNKKDGIVICNIGDGSMGCGPVWEAIMMSAMDQVKQLWDKGYNKGLPILFNFFNNQYGMGGQTRGETMGYDFLARAGAGVNPEQMHAERVDGYNPLAVIDAMKRKKEILTGEGGPVLLDVVTYRYAGHSPSDSSSYRTKEEIAAWEAQDAIPAYADKLIKAKVATKAEIDAIEKHVVETITQICAMAVDEKISPRMDVKANPRVIEDLMFSNTKMPKMSDDEVVTLKPKEESPRVQAIAKKERYGFDKDGKLFSKNKAFQLRDGLFEAIIDKYYEDPTLISYGEDVRDWGGAFAVYRGLTEVIPYHRLFNSPISEAAIAGSACGYAMSGGRVIAELMYCDFLGRAGDEVFNQIPKWQAMSAGVIKMPLVIRVSVGSKYGAQHSQDWSSLVAHIPGIKVIFPATPYDAKGLMASALNGTDPVICFESQRIYDVGEQFHKGGVPVESYEIPIGEPDVKREGSDVTILTFGATLYRAIKAADMLQEKYGISAEVIDARTLVPFNYDKVLESVKKTGKILLTSDACEKGSFINTMAQTISELAFDELDAPPVVVGARNWITPCFELDNDFFPQPEWMIDAIHEKIMPIPGHTPTNNFTPVERMRREKAGV